MSFAFLKHHYSAFEKQQNINTVQYVDYDFLLRFQTQRLHEQREIDASFYDGKFEHGHVRWKLFTFLSICRAEDKWHR